MLIAIANAPIPSAVATKTMDAHGRPGVDGGWTEVAVAGSGGSTSTCGGVQPPAMRRRMVPRETPCSRASADTLNAVLVDVRCFIGSQSLQFSYTQSFLLLGCAAATVSLPCRNRQSVGIGLSSSS